jgi:hypothetical protein
MANRKQHIIPFREFLSTDPNNMTLLQIIPDRSVANNQNKHFWTLLHELMILDHSLRERVTRDGLHFRYRMRNNIYCELVAKSTVEEVTNKDGEIEKKTTRQMYFYMGVPTRFVDTIKRKLYDKSPQITIEEVPLETIKISDTANITEYKYARHNIFSLKANMSEQNSPISSIMATTYDLQEDDSFRISMALERVDKGKWKKLCDYAWGQMKQKRVPVRVGIDPKQTANKLLDLTVWGFMGIKGILEDMLQAVHNSFFKRTEEISNERTKYEMPNREYEELMMEGELTTDTHKKSKEPVFKTKIRLAIESKSDERIHLIKYSINNALMELNSNNKLVGREVKVKIKGKHLEEMNTLQTKINDPDTNIMSVKEVGKLHQLPTSELQEKYRDILQTKKQVEVNVGQHFRDNDGILIGSTTIRGEEVPIHVPVENSSRGYDELMMSRVFIGSPRMGKDTALVNFVVEANKKGFGSVVLDVIDERGNDRGLADGIRDHIDPDKIIDLNMADLRYPIYVGLNEVVAKSENAGNRLANDFANIFEVADAGRTRTYLREAVKACEGDLLQVRLLLLSPAFRQRKIEELEAQEKFYAVEFWRAYDNESSGQQSEIRKPILTRLDEIFGDDHLKNMFGQKANPEIDFSKWLKEGKVIIVRVPNSHPDLSEEAVKTIAQWIVLKTFYTKLVMAEKDCCSFLVLNEPHQFMSDGLTKTLKRMLRECPKWRLSMLFAIHDFEPSTVPREFVDVLIGASLNWHIFKNTNDKVYSRLKTYLKPTYTPEQAMEQTPKYHSINSFFIGGEYKEPFLMYSLPPANERMNTLDNSFLTLRHSQLYGRKREEVEREIFEQERELFIRPTENKRKGKR